MSITVHQQEAAEVSQALMRHAATLDDVCEAATARKVAYFLRNLSARAINNDHQLVDIVGQTFKPNA